MRPDEKTEKERLCLSCQRCCREVSIYTHPSLYRCSAETVVEFYEARGFEVVRLEKGALLLSFPHTCRHLTPKGCAIYEKRPKACAEYSGVEDLGDRCLWSRLIK